MSRSIIEKFRCISQIPAALFVLTILAADADAQNCPDNVPVTINTNPNTYYPGLDNTLTAGSTAITLGASGSGTTPISTGDLLLLIQMQGAEIDSTNTNSYGDGVSGGPASGYLGNSSLLAGNMEYVVAANNIPLSGGTLNLLNGTVHSYRNAPYLVYGQYRFQVIRVGLYYNLTLGGSITAPAWNGTTGGLVVLSVTNQLDFNGQTISAAGKGFRGGGGRTLAGGTGGLLSDMVSSSLRPFNGSKAEGIAGTPRYTNNLGSLLDAGLVNEGYSAGSYAAGAPGNAGGGGTDGHPASNDENSGGGGGANGGIGGRGGNSWSSNLGTGGEAGALFAERSASRLVMGGGGGAGTTNNGTGVPGLGFSSSGAAGGGIILITANSIIGSGTINADGASAYTTTVNDGSGGGGAGGSVMIYAASGLSGITVSAVGGTGGSNSGGGTPPPHGPGGGGGGGAIFSNAPLSAASTVAGGSSGTTTGGIVFGSTPGSAGVLVQNITSNDPPPQYLNCSLLPARFISATANRKNNQVNVSWRIANETSVQHHAVEKSVDGKNFSVIGSVDYRPVFTSDNAYAFIDKSNTTAPVLYYRIKAVFKSGSVLYSGVMIIKSQDADPTSLTISPNPATGSSATVRFTVNSQSGLLVQLRMLSVTGAPVWQKQYKAVEGVNVVSLDNLASVPDGLYFVQYSDGMNNINQKIIVRH